MDSLYLMEEVQAEDESHVVGFREVDIAPFKRRMSEEERMALLHQKFPSAVNLNWKKAFDNDPDLLGHVLQDLLKLGGVIPGKSGRRPGLDPARAEPELDRMLGRDPTSRPYTLLPFPEAFSLLLGGRSLRSAENKIGMPKTRLHRLLKGETDPSAEEMEAIAKAYGKSASYFLEYRMRAIASEVFTQLSRQPEVTVRVYEKIWHAAGRK